MTMSMYAVSTCSLPHSFCHQKQSLSSPQHIKRASLPPFASLSCFSFDNGSIDGIPVNATPGTADGQSFYSSEAWADVSGLRLWAGTLEFAAGRWASLHDIQHLRGARDHQKTAGHAWFSSGEHASLCLSLKSYYEWQQNKVLAVYLHCTSVGRWVRLVSTRSIMTMRIVASW